MRGLIAFRADASTTVGYGHVMRCLAFADALANRGYRSLFIGSACGDALHDEIAGRGHLVRNLPAEITEEIDGVTSIKIAHDTGALQAMVMDHYGLGPSWQMMVRERGIPLWVIDDAPRAHYCDALLDQNLLVESGNPYMGYVPDDCRCYFGPRFALLRKDFSLLRLRCSIRKEVRRILIFFGGSDPTNETSKALTGVLQMDREYQIDVVIGSSHPHKEAIATQAEMLPGRFHLHIQTSKMAELMASADLAIGAGGSAAWERCCVRLPAIISVLADNQASIAEQLQSLGAAISLGPADALAPSDYAAAILALTPERVSLLSENCGHLTDGQGASRSADALDFLIRSKT